MSALQGDVDESNTTLFIGNLAQSVSQAELSQLFMAYGALAHVHVPPGKGFGFVQFIQRAPAQRALDSAQGYALHGQPMRISWGRNAAKGSAPTPGVAPAPAGYMQPTHGTLPFAHSARPQVPPHMQRPGGGGGSGAGTGTTGGQSHGPPMPAPMHPGTQYAAPHHTGGVAQALQTSTQSPSAAGPGHAHAQYVSGYHQGNSGYGLSAEAVVDSSNANMIGRGGFFDHPLAEKTASRFGFEDPLHYDFEGANRRFCSVAPPMLAPIAMAPARHVLRAGMAAIF
jgi:RNA recognition motif. (a.k.a. RRM, RBD, or RNP domain)